jgi:5-deoxy-glucuronate isomerase
VVSPLLFKARPEGRVIVEVTPEHSGWGYVGFRAVRLANGELESLAIEERELCLVVLSGRVDATIDGTSYAGLGTRASVFEPVAPAAVYVPPGRNVTLRARCGAEVALCTARARKPGRAVRIIDPASMRRSIRGQGNNMRFVCDILPHDNKTAEHLVVMEVLTPAGHSSSYPPHKRHAELPQLEAQLEETYYHRLHPPHGFAFQRIYTDDRSLDEACAVENHDLVLAPRGHHPIVAPHGYELYYLNVVAGRNRHLTLRNDPAHAWMLNS